MNEIADKTTEKTVEKIVEKAPAKKKKNKNKRTVPYGQVHIKATFNNTIITFTDRKGGKLTASSAGATGFKGSKKGTAYAAQVASEKAASDAKNIYSVSKVDVFVKGIGMGRDAAIKALSQQDIKVDSITDVTGVAHGGVRPKKARRV
ncbi:MAG: 30S ribosomal protein S11 [bacterium]|nr:30S ribosomal protein S11 [bacterium]